MHALMHLQDVTKLLQLLQSILAPADLLCGGATSARIIPVALCCHVISLDLLFHLAHVHGEGAAVELQDALL